MQRVQWAHSSVADRRSAPSPRICYATARVRVPIAALRNDANVAYAEPNYIWKAVATPNDPDYSKLWGMHNIGQTGGVSDADIDAPEAWDAHTGDENGVVGVMMIRRRCRRGSWYRERG